ncbi:TPA: hypothetical protein ACPILL_006337, partial [Pseudomonas aeruginosa]
KKPDQVRTWSSGLVPNYRNALRFFDVLRPADQPHLVEVEEVILTRLVVTNAEGIVQLVDVLRGGAEPPDDDARMLEGHAPGLDGKANSTPERLNKQGTI